MGQWQSQPVCTTAACLHASSYVLQNLASNWQQLDPCTQFDEMVCGGFREHNEDGSSTTDNMRKRNNRILKSILQTTSHEEAAGLRSTFLASRSTADEHNFDMLRTAYTSCMDTDAAASLGVKPLTDLIVFINKTWPVPPNDLKTKITASEYDGMAKAAIFLEKRNVFTLRTVVDDMPVVSDPLNSNTNRFLVGLPKTAHADPSFYLDPESLDKYTQSIAAAFLLSYPNIDNKTASALAVAVASFEADLAQTLAPHRQIVTMYNVWEFVKNASLADITAVAPAVVLDKIVAGLSPAGQAPSEILLEDLEPSRWPKISKIISSHPRAAVQGYMIWRLIESTAPLLTAPEFMAAMGFPPIAAPRVDLCLELINTMVPHILDHYYLSTAYSDAALQATEKMTTAIRTQFKKRIGELEWMSDEAKKRATKKVDNLRQNIGYNKANPNVRSTDSLADYYQDLNITSAFYANIMEARRHASDKTYAALGQPIDRNAVVGGAASMVNAFYNQYANSMIIMAGISQLPLFHPDLPQYAQFAGLGGIIGHELTHGFDSNGYKYDENAERRAWWDNTTVANYVKRTQCFVDQYSAYEVEVPTGKQKLDGKLTLGENLADAGGLGVAYEAWQAERKSMPDTWDQNLPGLENFTHEQLFFIINGNSWCQAATPESNAAQLAQGDSHAHNQWRIKGPVANSRAFKDAFKCKVREPQCEAW